MDEFLIELTPPIDRWPTDDGLWMDNNMLLCSIDSANIFTETIIYNSNKYTIHPLNSDYVQLKLVALWERLVEKKKQLHIKSGPLVDRLKRIHNLFRFKKIELNNMSPGNERPTSKDRKIQALKNSIEALNSINKQLRDRYALYDEQATLMGLGIHIIYKPFHDYSTGTTTYATDIIQTSHPNRVKRSPRLDSYEEALRWAIDYTKENLL